MRSDPIKKRKSVLRSSPPLAIFKLNVDGAAGGKSRLAGIGGRSS